MTESINSATRKLLPCPFCGGEAGVQKYRTESLFSHDEVEFTQVGCSDCDVFFISEEAFEVEAPAAWNTRYVAENINSEALDHLFEIDGQLYGVPSLVRMARIRAGVLHASAAWGSSDDGALIGALADRVEQLREALRWALAELNGKTRYDNDDQLEACFARAEAVLASVLSDQDNQVQSDKSCQVSDAIDGK